MPPFTVSLKAVYTWPCSYSNVFEFITTCWSLVSAVLLSVWPCPYFSHITVFTSFLMNFHQARYRHFLCRSRSLPQQTAMNKVHEAAQRQESASSSRLQRPSESYWRDTWHHPSSGLSPDRCCCCACASYRSSDTACTLSPERITEQVTD